MAVPPLSSLVKTTPESEAPNAASTEAMDSRSVARRVAARLNAGTTVSDSALTSHASFDAWIKAKD